MLNPIQKSLFAFASVQATWALTSAFFRWRRSRRADVVLDRFAREQLSVQTPADIGGALAALAWAYWCLWLPWMTSTNVVHMGLAFWSALLSMGVVRTFVGTQIRGELEERRNPHPKTTWKEDWREVRTHFWSDVKHAFTGAPVAGVLFAIWVPVSGALWFLLPRYGVDGTMRVVAQVAFMGLMMTTMSIVGNLGGPADPSLRRPPRRRRLLVNLYWELDVYRFDGPRPAVEDVMDREDIWASGDGAPVIGSAAAVKAQITAAFPDVVWNDVGSVGTTSGRAWTLDLMLGAFYEGPHDPVRVIHITVSGSGEPVTAIAGLCKANGWAVIDLVTDEYLELDAPSSVGWVTWQTFAHGANEMVARTLSGAAPKVRES